MSNCLVVTGTCLTVSPGNIRAIHIIPHLQTDRVDRAPKIESISKQQLGKQVLRILAPSEMELSLQSCCRRGQSP